MTEDIEVLTRWIEIFLVTSSVSATTVPVIYAFFPWYRSRLGRTLMFQSIAFSLALDVTTIFHFWMPSNIMLIFWTNTIIFGLITLATLSVNYMMIMLNRTRRVDQDATIPE
jgi:hypothetical protein